MAAAADGAAQSVVGLARRCVFSNNRWLSLFLSLFIDLHHERPGQVNRG